MKQRAIIIVIALFIGINLPAQEVLVGLGENAQVPRMLAKTTQSAQRSTPLELPFVDDFAKPTNFQPDQSKWLDNKVFINNSFALNPPTVGVATFDPFDSEGKVYSHANSVNFIADSLTSQPINLDYRLSDSIYISFFYQPQGYGDMPEIDDTLALQFYIPSTNEWETVWRVSVHSKKNFLIENHYGEEKTITAKNLGSEFYRVHLPINRLQYFNSNFQFRFVNAASIALNNNIIGRSTAADHWHIDYVYLDKNRTSTDLSLPDIAITQPQAPLSPVYESIPATHLSMPNAINDLFTEPMKMQLNYTNLGWGTRSVTRNFSITPLYGGGAPVNYSGGAENIPDYDTIPYVYQAPLYQYNTSEDSAAFEIRSYLITDRTSSAFRADLRENDTVRYIQRFANYYAFDDGTAENGYGLFGAGTAAGRVAMRFSTYKTDSIRGVYLYFNRTVDSLNQLPFVITVWDDANGLPNEIIHQEKVTAPVFSNLNTYVAYKFSTPIALAKDQYFHVGWTQLQEGFLNIGYDRNRNHGNKIFYNIKNEWEQSLYDGSLMLRPIFCRTDADFPPGYIPPIIKPSDNGAQKDFFVYPNPSSLGFMRVVDSDTQLSPQNELKMELFDAFGRLVSTSYNNNGVVDVSNIAKGMYFIRVWENGKSRGTKRIVVN